MNDQEQKDIFENFSEEDLNQLSFPFILDLEEQDKPYPFITSEKNE